MRVSAHIGMVTFILPGYSVHNKKWEEEVAKNLKMEGEIRPIFWDHWTDDSQKFDPKEKADLISRHTKGDKINIIAKSLGCLVAAYIAEEIPDQVNKIILCGIPVTDLKEGDAKLISKVPNKNLIVFQNNHDPHGSFERVKKLFPNFKIIEKGAGDHNYPYFEDFNNFLSP